MKAFFLIIIFLVQFSYRSIAQAGRDRIQMAVSAEDLFSTHATHFFGTAAGIDKRFSKLFSAGAGIEYSRCGYHDDNGWNLYNLNFIPVYLLQNFYPLRFNNFEPYVRLQEGVSFISYDKEDQDNLGPRSHINEKGFYGYGGLGSNYWLRQKLGLFLEAGIKSFHISNDNLEVKPHGFTGKLGIKYAFR